MARTKSSLGATVVWRDSVPPTVNDDKTIGVKFLNMWQETDSNNVWVCTNPAAGAAQWAPFVMPAGYYSSATSVGYGIGALASHATGDDNTAVGAGALASTGNSGAFGTTAVGAGALAALGGGSSVPQYTTAVGAGAGAALLDSEELTLVGNNALADSTVSYFTAVIGSNAGNNLADCNYSVLIGAFAGQGDPGAAVERSVIIGYGAGLDVEGIDWTVLIGNASGATLTTGDGNTLIGSNTDVSTGTISNAVAIGRGAVASQDNQLALGSSSYPLRNQTTVGGAGAASALPATPELYAEVRFNGGTYVFPLYLAA